MTTQPLDASWITTAIILVSFTAPVWYTYLTFRSGRGGSHRKALFIAAIATVWGLLMFGVVRFGWLDGFPGGRPVLSLFTLAIPLTIVFRNRHWLIGDGLSQRWLVGLQLFRVIGAVFLLEMVRGNITGVFAHPAGWGDILAGLTALVVLVSGLRTERLSERGILAVAVVGILDFISAFSFGFLSAAGPWQLLSLDMPNLVYLYPTGLIPMFLVPYASIFHILSLTQYARDKKSEGKQKPADHSHHRPVLETPIAQATSTQK